MAPFASQMQRRSQSGVSSNLLSSKPPESAVDAGGSAGMKCVLVGDGAVGKTSLLVSYTTNGYPTEYVPTAYDNYNVRVTVDNQPISLQLCDTAGQDDFDALRPLCYPGTDVFLLCFSVVSPTSFHNIKDKWLPEIRRHCPAAPVILVGTQCDLRTDVKVLIELASYREQPVSEMQAKRLAQLIDAEMYLESSALTQKNLKEVFDTAIMVGLQQVYNHQLDKRKSKIPNYQNITNNNNNNLLLKSFGKQCDQRIENDFDCETGRKSGWKKLCCLC